MIENFDIFSMWVGGMVGWVFGWFVGYIFLEEMLCNDCKKEIGL